MRSHPVLRRFGVYVYKAKGPSDPRRIPAYATINFYRQGATVRADVSVPYSPPADPMPVDVQVWNAGAIQLADQVAVDNTGLHLDVTGFISSDPDNIRIRVVNTTILEGIQLLAEQRLIPLSNRPDVYQDPTGEMATGDPLIVTNASTGLATCYIKEPRFDYGVVISGEAMRVFADAVGGFVMR